MSKLQEHLGASTTLLFEHLIFPSFEISYGYDVHFSASDMVHGVSASLSGEHACGEATTKTFWCVHC